MFLLKSESGWTVYCEISETTCFTEEKKQFFDLLMDHDYVPPLESDIPLIQVAALVTSTNLLVARAAAHFAPYVNPLGSFFEKIWVRPTIKD